MDKICYGDGGNNEKHVLVVVLRTDITRGGHDDRAKTMELVLTITAPTSAASLSLITPTLNPLRLYLLPTFHLDNITNDAGAAHDNNLTKTPKFEKY